MAEQFHLADLFETVAATLPDRIAIISDSVTLTYAELNERASRIASGLAQHGIKRGDTVGLYMYNQAEHLEAFIATCKLGAVPFNINYRYGLQELTYLLSNAQAAAIVHGAEFSPMMRDLEKVLPDLRLSVAVADGTDTDCSGSLDYAQLLEHEDCGPWERSEDDYLLTYTGGTTGMPKGVMWPHRAFVFACAGGGGFFNPKGPMEKPQDAADRSACGFPLRMLPVAPLMHGAAFWAVWSAMLNGLTIVLETGRHFDPVALWSKVAEHKVNLVQVVGDAMAVPLRDALRDNPGRWDLATVVNFGSGGAVFSDHVKADIKSMLPPTAGITDGVGASETGMCGAGEKSDQGILRLPCDENQRVVVGDRFAEVGESGLIARSGNIPIGYFNDPEKSAEVFRELDGRLWAISGDSGRLDDDGKITMFGRGSTCINSGGEKIYPEEVEEALRSHPAIHDAVVIAEPSERWGEQVAAILSPCDTDVRPDLAQVRDAMKAKLAAYKHPKTLIWVDNVKRSAAGKHDFRWARTILEQQREHAL